MTSPNVRLGSVRLTPGAPYYRDDLALVHHLGFGFHADMCAPGILRLLEPVLTREGVVLELGCGSGLLTKYLVDAGHRVIATDARQVRPKDGVLPPQRRRHLAPRRRDPLEHPRRHLQDPGAAGRTRRRRRVPDWLRRRAVPARPRRHRRPKGLTANRVLRVDVWPPGGISTLR